MQYKKIGIYYNTNSTPKQKDLVAQIVKSLNRHSKVINLTEMPEENVDVIIPIGGDGLGLRCINHFMKHNVPFYGINLGTIGFLMNDLKSDRSKYFESICQSIPCITSPIECQITTTSGNKIKRFSINDVAIFRRIQQTINMEISVNNIVRIANMRADGIIFSSPIGSSGYNFSLHGPILPINSQMVALTPAAPFYPRNWRGAILEDTSVVEIKIKDITTRPAYIAVDNHIEENISSAKMFINKSKTVQILFDKEIPIQEKLIQEQFLYR